MDKNSSWSHGLSSAHPCPAAPDPKPPHPAGSFFMLFDFKLWKETAYGMDLM